MNGSPLTVSHTNNSTSAAILLTCKKETIFSQDCVTVWKVSKAEVTNSAEDEEVEIVDIQAKVSAKKEEKKNQLSLALHLNLDVPQSGIQPSF